METLETINQRMLETWGRGVAEQPLYRVVWTTKQTERRYGTFIKETEAGIYLGSETCERECPKYPMLPDYWVLEWIQPNIGNPELLAQWSYEPLYFFKDKHNRPLPYDWEIIETVIKFHQTRVIHRNEAMIAAEEEEKKRKEADEYYDILKQTSDAFSGKLHNHEGVVISNTDYLIKEK